MNKLFIFFNFLTNVPQHSWFIMYGSQSEVRPTRILTVRRHDLSRRLSTHTQTSTKSLPRFTSRVGNIEKPTLLRQQFSCPPDTLDQGPRDPRSPSRPDLLLNVSWEVSGRENPTRVGLSPPSHDRSSLRLATLKETSEGSVHVRPRLELKKSVWLLRRFDMTFE